MAEIWEDRGDKKLYEGWMDGWVGGGWFLSSLKIGQSRSKIRSGKIVKLFNFWKSYALRKAQQILTGAGSRNTNFF